MHSSLQFHVLIIEHNTWEKYLLNDGIYNQRRYFPINTQQRRKLGDVIFNYHVFGGRGRRRGGEGDE
jgi:hypothetical protein